MIRLNEKILWIHFSNLTLKEMETLNRVICCKDIAFAKSNSFIESLLQVQVTLLVKSLPNT